MNLAKDALHILTSIAPTAATMLGGPFAGMAVTKLEELFGVAGNADAQQQIEAAIMGGNPDALLKLKQLEGDMSAKLAELGIQRDKLILDDTANARAREIAVKDKTPSQLAWMIIGGFITVSAAQLIAIMGWPEVVAKIPGQGWLLIGNVSGYLANEAKQAAAYYFGSTMGSQSKDQALAEIAKQP
jgi:hypothetical protein